MSSVKSLLEQLLLKREFFLGFLTHFIEISVPNVFVFPQGI